MHATVTAAGRAHACKQFTEYLMLGSAEGGMGLAVRFLLSAQLSHPPGQLTCLAYRLGSGVVRGGRVGRTE